MSCGFDLLSKEINFKKKTFTCLEMTYLGNYFSFNLDLIDLTLGGNYGRENYNLAVLSPKNLSDIIIKTTNSYKFYCETINFFKPLNKLFLF